MKLDNWFYADRISQLPILPPVEGDNYSIYGIISGSEKFQDGKPVCTSSVAVYDKETQTVTTKSGSIYELGEVNSDYRELVEAYQAKMPILTHWRLRGVRRFGFTFIGYSPSGNTEVRGRVQAQSGNRLTIDGVEYFVIWTDWGDTLQARHDAFTLDEYCGLKISDFERFCGLPLTRPVLFPEGALSVDDPANPFKET